MKNLREVKDDLLKEWLEFREETAFSEMTPQDKKYCIYFDEIAEKILKNVPEQNKKYVHFYEKQTAEGLEEGVIFIAYSNELKWLIQECMYLVRKKAKADYYEELKIKENKGVK